MLDDLNSIVGFCFSTLSQIFNLYLGGGILSGVLAMHGFRIGPRRSTASRRCSVSPIEQNLHFVQS